MTTRLLDGKQTRMDVMSKPINSDGAGPVYDITEQRQILEALQRSEAMLHTLTEVIPSIIWIADPDGNVTFHKKEWLTYTGITQEQQAASWPELVLHPDDLERYLHSWHTALQHSTSYEIEVRLKRHDGRYHWFLTRALPLRDSEGTITAWLGSTTDIHAQKLAEEELGMYIAHDIDERQEHDRRKDEFLNVISYELKTPLTMLKAFTQLLSRQLEPSGMLQATPLLVKMEKQVDRLIKLVDTLLDAFAIQAGHLDYEEKQVDIDALVGETVEHLQPTCPTHTLHVIGATNALLVGDKDRLGQALTNLITNAVKYSPQADSVDIVLTASRQTATICVRDYGIGISRSQQQHIFERFYKAKISPEKTVSGLGMGLSIAREVVRRHGGTISLESEEGKGSTFLISLPLKKEQ